MIRNRKKNWIGHILRGDGIVKEVIEGRMEGKRSRGRPRAGMLDDLVVVSYGDTKRRAENIVNGGVGYHGPAGRQRTKESVQ